MSHKNSKVNKSTSGFTIIEVLIVLAIAGLIMLIVFLAVPALQRNSRNTAIKNDVQNVVGGVAEYQAANNGSMPTNVNGTGTVNYSGSTNATSINIQGSTQVRRVTTRPTTVPAGEIQVILGQKCPVGTANPVSSTRAIAAYYSIETTTELVVQCTDS